MFENKTDYDETLMKAVARFSCRTRLRRRILVVRCVLFVCAAGILAVSLLLDVWSFLRVCAVAVGIAVLLEGIFYERMIVRNNWKALKGDCGERDFTFLEDRMEITRTSGAKASYPYADFSDLYETGDYFIPLIGGIRHAAMRKDGFTRGSAGDFRAFIQERTGKAFRSIKL